MEKIILVDGNNLLFRSYYATAYNGNFMKNSKGFPTNALFGFTNMMNKIILEEKPTHIIVAFDKGKTFRHEMFDNYKAERIEMPNELRLQFPIAKELLDAMGIKWYEIENYEADDIIGTFAKYCDLEPGFIGTIISSDKDLLQLISKDVDIKLLKSKDYIRYNEESFQKEYGILPINIIDLKALMGDPSDNIPGVKGIGEKTALKLLQEYKTLDGVYENINNIKGALKDKLINDKDNAYFSYKLATIVKDVPMTINIKDIVYSGNKSNKLNQIYENLEFYSFLKKEEIIPKKENKYVIINDIKDINIKGECAIYLEILGTNYHTAPILGLGVYNEDVSYYIPFSVIKDNPEFLIKNIKYTYDLKKIQVAFKNNNIKLENVTFDTMIAAYLLDYNVKEDIAYLANMFEYDIPFYETVYGKTRLITPDLDVIAYNTTLKAKFIYESKKLFEEKIKKEKIESLFYDMEMPLALVLAKMELNGVNVNVNALDELGEELKIKTNLLTRTIYNEAGMEFNISSPKQLGEVLFDKLNLRTFKGKSSTNIDILSKLKGKHPIIDHVIEYRLVTKLYSTYVEGLKNNILKDGKIHTIYTQTLTRTGRLSSIEPNLQNIPVRSDLGRLIRKAFIPSNNSLILSGDYSQIELRVLAHMSKVDSLIEAFKHNIDIHTKTASDLFKIDIDEVSPNQRRMAKAVNFGIIYGISEYGLAENTGLTNKEAKEFIENYLKIYPGVKEYMDKTIKDAYDDCIIKTLYGRSRRIDELSSTNYMIRKQGERIALNTPIQGTSADIIKMAMVKVDKMLTEKNLKAKMILQVHDELVFDVPKEELNVLIKEVTNIMENIVKLEVPLKIDINYGNNWYEAK
ncbi:MAG: DNA polymerase I [Bacilli bacterium]|nr:DNA polymerase I [Bacilli bacterium]